MVELEVRATDFRGGVLCGQGDIAGGGGAGKGESGGGGQREALGEGCALIKSYGSGHRAPGFEPRPRSSSLM